MIRDLQEISICTWARIHIRIPSSASIVTFEVPTTRSSSNHDLAQLSETENRKIKQAIGSGSCRRGFRSLFYCFTLREDFDCCIAASLLGQH